MKNTTCQSCGMPIHKPEMHGTGKDGMPVEEYCVYCYKDGGFTSDVTMDEMMRLCLNYVDNNKHTFYMANMRMQYPHLKRWAIKEDTENEYYKSINLVLDHLKHNLHENTDLKTLSAIARISPYHFHRIFKSVIGESLAKYVNRLRMEYVVEQLKSSALSLAQLAERTGYSSEQALSRAFKEYFNIPPKAFKTTYFTETFGGKLSPRICKVAQKNVIMLREVIPGNEGWKKLYVYSMVKRLLSEKMESIEVIIDGIYRPALTTDNLQQADKHAETLILPEARYAIFTYKGVLEDIPALIAAINNYWLPKSRYSHLPEVCTYIVYLNNPVMVPAHALLSEIYFPLMIT